MPNLKLDSPTKASADRIMCWFTCYQPLYIIAPLSAIFGQTSVNCQVKERSRQWNWYNGGKCAWFATNSNILARKERVKIGTIQSRGRVKGFAQHITPKLRRRWLFSAPVHKNQLDALPRQIRRHKKNEREQNRKKFCIYRTNQNGSSVWLGCCSLFCMC